MRPAATWRIQPRSTSIRTETSTKKMFITFGYSLADRGPRRRRPLHQHRQLLLRRRRRLHLLSLQRPQQHLQLPRLLLLRPGRRRGRAQLLILAPLHGECSESQLARRSLARRWVISEQAVAGIEDPGRLGEWKGELCEPLADCRGSRAGGDLAMSAGDIRLGRTTTTSASQSFALHGEEIRHYLRVFAFPIALRSANKFSTRQRFAITDSATEAIEIRES